MGGTTPVLALPYPTGSDRVADGDNAMQALAERIEARMPRGFLGEGIGTTVQGGITTADIIGVTVTLTVPAGRRLRVTSAVTLGGTQPSWAEFRLMMDGVIVGMAADYANAGHYSTGKPEWAGVPSAGSHTWKVQVSMAQGTGVTYVDATKPQFIRVEDIGI